MNHRQIIVVSLLCVRLSGAPLPLAHSHDGLEGAALAFHLALHHSQAVQPGDWHWHLVGLEESAIVPTIEKPAVDLAEAEVSSGVQALDELLLCPMPLAGVVVDLRSAEPTRRIGRIESHGGPSPWRNLLCVRTL